MVTDKLTNDSGKSYVLRSILEESITASCDFGFDKLSKPNGRISNSLSSNLAMRKQTRLFEELSEEDRVSLALSDSENYIDRRGKTISISVEETQLIKALSSYIPFNDPEIVEYMEAIGRVRADGGSHTKVEKNIRIPVSVSQLCKDIVGDTKEATIIKMGKRLRRLAEISHAQTFKTSTGNFIFARPLIHIKEAILKRYSEIRTSRGRKKSSSVEVEEEAILVAAQIEFSPLFLYKASNSFCPIFTSKLMPIWRKNKTEIFSILLSDLESKWRQYFINSIKAEAAASKEYKELRSTNSNEYQKLVNEAKTKALIYKSSTLTIRDRVTTDYETDKTQRRRFIPDLQRAINSLVEYGIITDKSVISKDKAFVFFCYNPDFIAIKENACLQADEEAKEV